MPVTDTIKQYVQLVETTRSIFPNSDLEVSNACIRLLQDGCDASIQIVASGGRGVHWRKLTREQLRHQVPHWLWPPDWELYLPNPIRAAWVANKISAGDALRARLQVISK